MTTQSTTDNRVFSYSTEGIIAAIELVAVAGVVAASALRPRYLPVLLTVMALYAVGRWFVRGRPSVRTPVDLPIAVFVATLPVALFFSPQRGTSVEQILRVVAGVAVYYALVYWTQNRRRLRFLLNALLVAGSLLACGGLVAIRWSATDNALFIPSAIYARFPLLVSDVINPNVMAGALALLLPFAVAMPLFAADRLRWFEWVVCVVSLVMMTGMLLLTQSRGAMIGLAVALLCLAALRWRRGIALVASAVVVGLAALVLQWWADAGALLRVIQTIGSLDNRLIIWSRAWQMVQDYPLTGIGMGTFKYRLDTTYPLFQSTFNIPHAHNLFLQIALDLGVVGLLAWLSIVALLIRAAWRVYRSGRARGEAWTAGLGAGLIASHAAMLTHGVFDAVVWGMVRTAVMVWVVWAFATIAQRLLVGRAKGDADAAHLNDVLE